MFFDSFALDLLIAFTQFFNLVITTVLNAASQSTESLIAVLVSLFAAVFPYIQ